MDRSGVLAVILLVLIVAEGSDGSMLGSFRKMVGIAPRENYITTEISPSPGPISNARSDPPVPGISPRGSEKDTSEEGINEKCKVSSKNCTVQNMVACLQSPENGSQELFLLVQNEGETTLKVNVSVPDSVKISSNELEIPKHQAKKINVSVNVGESPEIVLNAGNGDCVLHFGVPISEGNYFPWIPSYATRVTPIYGAYFLFLIALIVGGTWACCKFGKRGRRGDGVPYQELEMGMPGPSSAVHLQTADGWDQGWDDGWDEERAVRSPGGQHVGNVSANGLTSRSSNRDGWENDWDD